MKKLGISIRNFLRYEQMKLAMSGFDGLGSSVRPYRKAYFWVPQAVWQPLCIKVRHRNMGMAPQMKAYVLES